jgi:hypothetical protein
MKRLLATPIVIVGTVVAVVLAGAPAARAHASATVTVKPGESIQDAVDNAQPGDTIRLLRGTYVGGVYVHTNSITIRGAGAKTILVPNGTDHCAGPAAGSGICVVGTPTQLVTGVTIKSLTVHGFKAFGVIGFGTDHLRVKEVTASQNGDYGITEFESTRGWFTDNWVIDNAADAGLYVGDIADAEGTVVAGNHATGNALGVLVRHAHHVNITENWLEGNCTGIALVDDGQPGGQGDTWVEHNHVVSNNKVCPAQGDVPALGGTGVAVLGGDNNTITENRINDNSGTQPFSGGVVLLPGVTAHPASGNVVSKNEIEHNSPFDVIDHSGGTNTIQHNECTTSDPAGLCG